MNSRAFAKTGWSVHEISLGFWEFGSAIHLAGRVNAQTVHAVKKALVG